MVKRFPDFLCIGAQKAATTWLWEILNQHPNVWMPPIKEIHFFDHLFIPENRSWTKSGFEKTLKKLIKKESLKDNCSLEYIEYLASLSKKDSFSIAWYSRCFDYAPNRSVLGEITPSYSILPLHGIKYVREKLGENLKLIFIIRNPQQRYISQLKMNISRKFKSSAKVDVNSWMNEAKSTQIKIRGDYEYQIENWFKVYDRSNFLFIPFGKIKNEPHAIIKDCENFLGINSRKNYNLSNKQVHKTKEFDVPKEVINYFGDVSKKQFDYIEKVFGKEFTKSI